jgi:hypothetical protein
MSKIEIQINDDAPFIPDEIIRADIEYGKTEITKEGDEVRAFIPETLVATIHYKKDGLEHLLFYTIARWETSDSGLPRLHVRETNG